MVDLFNRNKKIHNRFNKIYSNLDINHNMYIGKIATIDNKVNSHIDLINTSLKNITTINISNDTYLNKMIQLFN